MTCSGRMGRRRGRCCSRCAGCRPIRCWWWCRPGRGSCPGWARAGSVSWPGTTGPAGSGWAAWGRRMWWRWAGRWGLGSCRAAPSAVCSSRPAGTRCTAGRCWKRPRLEGLDRGEALRVPRSLAGVVLLRVGALSPAARELVAAAAVLGHHCELAAAAALAGLADPLPALGEAVAAGILAEQPGGAAAGIGFSHLLVQRAVYGDLSPAAAAPAARAGGGPGGSGPGAGAPGGGGGRPGRRAGRRAGGGRPGGPTPGPDGAGGGLAGAGGGGQQRARRRPIAACWTRWRSWSPTVRWPRPRSLPPGWRPPGRARGAAGCWARWISSPAGPPRPRPGCWRRGRPTIGPGTRPRAPRPPPSWRCCAWSRAGSRRRSNGVSGRPRPAPPRPPCATGPWACWRSPFRRMGGDPRAWPGWRSCPPPPSEVPREDTDTLVLRGMARVWAEDLAGAIADLSTAAARLRAGVPLRSRQPVPELPGERRVPPRLLGRRRGARRAGRLARPRRRPGVGLRLGAHVAAVVPALRGDWEVASAHVRMATEAAQAVGDPGAIGAAATARAFLAMARGDLEGVTDAAAAVRATGRAQFLSLLLPLRLAIPRDRRPHRPGPPRPGRNGAGRARGGPVTGRPAVGPGGRRPAARRPGRRGRAPGRRRRGVPDRLAPRPGPAGAAGTGPAGDLRRPPAARRRPAAAGRRPAALGPAAPDHARRPALPAGSATGSSPPPARPRSQKPHPPASASPRPSRRWPAWSPPAAPTARPQPSSTSASRPSSSTSGTSSTSSASDPAKTSSPASAPRRHTRQET